MIETHQPVGTEHQIVALRWERFTLSLAMGNSESSEKAQAQAQPAEEHQPSALVIVGPSGVGKGTLINKLMAGNDRYGFSCSHTTRTPRQGEKVWPVCTARSGTVHATRHLMQPSLCRRCSM